MLTHNEDTRAGWVNGTRVRLLDTHAWTGNPQTLKFQRMGHVPYLAQKVDLANTAKYPEFNIRVIKDEEATLGQLAEFCATDPKRLIGIGMAAIPSPEEGVRELEAIARSGFKGVMLCGDAAFEDYDHPSYDPVWEAAIGLGLPISFHILTGRESYGMEVRGPKVIQQIVTVRGNQNIMMMMVLSGVFDRHPDLRVVMVENDAGWLPHFCFRMDHAWERHRWSLEIGAISRPPSEYVSECVYATFQDDSSLRHVIDAVNLDRIMWASDFPHGDGTYPNSQAVIDEVTEGMTEEQKHAVVNGNAVALYGH